MSHKCSKHGQGKNALKFAANRKVLKPFFVTHFKNTATEYRLIMLKLVFRNIGLQLDEKFNLELRKLYRVRFC